MGCATRDTFSDETMPAIIYSKSEYEKKMSKIRVDLLQCITSLNSKGFTVKQAHKDTDTLIVNTAIEETSNSNSVTIVGEDVDLLVILTELAESKQNIFFLKQGRGKTETKLYIQASIKYESDIKDHILFFTRI